LKGEYNPNPLKVKKSQGKKAYDIVRLQDVFNFIISPNLIEALEENKLTGWKVYNIESDIEIPGYKGFQCIGKCGTPLRPKISGFVTGYNFDINTWDGRDFFIPETTMMIICTKKAKDIIEGFKIKNIELENLKTLEWYNA
jgi:predicted nucleotidyltransferase